MFILIDCHNHRALAKHRAYIALAALSYIQFANVDTTILPLDGTNRPWSRFDESELVKISINMQVPIRYTKDLRSPSDYTDLIRELRSILERDKSLMLPFDEAALVAQARTIPASASEPFAFVPNAALPQRVPTWFCAPHRNRRRDESSYWTDFSPQPAQVVALTPPQVKKPVPPAKPGTPKRPSSPPQPAAATSKGNAAPKPSKAATTPTTRPKAGTSTGKVWDIADRISAAYVGADRFSKAVRASIIEECEKAGINPATAGVQYSKWAKAQS